MGWAIDAIRRLSRARWPLRGELVPRAIRGGAESAAESAQRSIRPPPQGAGPGTAPSLIQRAQPDISTLLETGPFYSMKSVAQGAANTGAACGIGVGHRRGTRRSDTSPPSPVAQARNRPQAD